MRSVLEDAQNTFRAFREIKENSAIRQIMRDIERSQAAMRAAIGPIEDLRRIGAFNFDVPWRREMERAQQVLIDFEARFHLPELGETASLLAKIRANPVSEIMEKYHQTTTELQRAFESMRTPWLDGQNAIRSAAAFAETQGIGHLLGNMPTFAEDLSAGLRASLGDWRAPITWRPEILTDLVARSEFYESLGFDTTLTDFPAQAFEESLDIAGLRREPPTLIDRYGCPVPRSGDKDEEESLARTNMAHDWLLRLETQLRAFIDAKMTEAFGVDWPKHRLPKELREEWQNKKRKAEQEGGKEWPLIAYADFTDYERVICKRDNWREIFEPFFHRAESVRESFQRLHPIRLDTMHARPITQDDELLLYIETRRLVKVIVV